MRFDPSHDQPPGGDVTWDMQRVDVGGYQLRVMKGGAGPPHFVCLHGLADTLEIWSRIAGALAARGEVVLVDQRAHGESDAPPGPYRREDLAADVRALLDRVAVPRAILIGHSMGGIVAMTTALAYPERIAGLVLLGTASECSARVAGWYERIARAAETDGLAGLASAIYGGVPPRPLRGDAPGLAHVTRCLASLAADPLTPRLAAIACPALLVVGEKDPMGAGASVIIQRHLREATLEVVPECGHWLHVDAADALLAALDRFLATHALTGGRGG
jgi:pimeloyl-ACP methyl ester carboxylesterase